MTQPGGLFSFGTTQQAQQPAQTGFGSGTGSAFGGGGGFSFGQPTAAAPQQQQAPAFSFGNPTGAGTTGSLFGGAPAAGTTAFGQPAAGATFGQPAAGATFGQPAAGGGTAFGQAAPAAGGATAFGQPASAPAGASMFSFGSNPAAAPAASTGTSFGFGQTPGQAPAAQTGFSFGSTPAGTAAPSFGAAAPSFGAAPVAAPAAAPTAGFGFGSTPAPAQQQPAAAFSFGQTQPATALGAAPGGLGGATTGLFGAAPASAPTSAAPATGFSFGSTPAPAATTTGTGLTFGTPAASAPTATAAVAPFSFGAKLATTSAPSTAGTLGGFSFGAPSGTSTSTAPAATSQAGFGFGTTSTASAPTLGTGLFGASSAITSTSASTAPIFSFGTKLGAPAATTAPALGGFGIGGQPAAAVSSAAAPSSGLGGLPKYATTGAETSFAFGGGGTDGKTENRALQELPLPQEMLLLVEELKNQIKSNKLKFTELNRSSNDALISKVGEEIEEVRSAVTVVANLIQKQTSNCEAIRALVHEGIADAEMANQTKDTPLGSQADHTSPIQYFFRLVDKYRDRMNIYLREIEKAESSLSYVLSAQSGFTSKELLDACNVTRNSIIALAAKVQILHEDVVRMVEAHRNLQRYLLGETTDLNVTPGPKQSLAFSRVLGNKDENRFPDVSVLFPHKIVEPPKIGSINMTQAIPGKPTTPGSALTSTPIRQTHHQRQMMNTMNKSSDSLFYPSHALFQTQQSTILSSTQHPSQSPPPHISLKRSKR